MTLALIAALASALAQAAAPDAPQVNYCVFDSAKRALVVEQGPAGRVSSAEAAGKAWFLKPQEPLALGRYRYRQIGRPFSEVEKIRNGELTFYRLYDGTPFAMAKGTDPRVIYVLESSAGCVFHGYMADDMAYKPLTIDEIK